MRKFLLLLFLTSFSIFAFAQDQDSISVERKNVVKFLPVNLPLQSFSFEYERMINAKNSLTIGIGIPNQKSLIGKYGIDNDPDSELKEASLGTTHIRAAYRHYTGKKELPKGFYIEPFLKYQHIKGKCKAELTSDEDITYTGDLTASFNTFSAGFQMGVQFLIAKRVTLDFYFLGIEGGMVSGNVNARVVPSDNIPDMKKEVEDAIADLPSSLGSKLKVTSTDDAVNVKASSIPFPWLRSGISIGIAF